MKPVQEYTYMDLHTAGEPFRLIIDPTPAIPGKTMEEKRRYASEHLGDLRRLVLREPRGHDNMYGGLLMPPVREGSDIGILFMTTEGMTTMCGHGIICLTRTMAKTF